MHLVHISLHFAHIEVRLDMSLEGKRVLSEKIKHHEKLLLEFTPVVFDCDVGQSLVSVLHLHVGDTHCWDFLPTGASSVTHY